LDLKVIIRDSVKQLSGDNTIPEHIRNELSVLQLATNEVLEVWEKFKNVFESFNGSAEKFYSKMFKFSLPDTVQVFPRVPRLVSNLLVTEVTTACLHHLTKEKVPDESDKSFQWDDKSRSIVEYLAGYCFRTMFTRLHRSKKRRDAKIQQLLAILKSAKLDDQHKQRLVNIKDRGGLWALKSPVIRIFEICEEEFYVSSQGFMKSLNGDDMVVKLCKNIIVRSNFKQLCQQCDVQIAGEYSKNLLEKLIQLYLRVRSHAAAKSIKESAKLESKQSKKKSLRTELKRADTES